MTWYCGGIVPCPISGPSLVFCLCASVPPCCHPARHLVPPGRRRFSLHLYPEVMHFLHNDIVIVVGKLCCANQDGDWHKTDISALSPFWTWVLVLVMLNQCTKKRDFQRLPWTVFLTQASLNRKASPLTNSLILLDPCLNFCHFLFLGTWGPSRTDGKIQVLLYHNLKMLGYFQPNIGSKRDKLKQDFFHISPNNEVKQPSILSWNNPT